MLGTIISSSICMNEVEERCVKVMANICIAIATAALAVDAFLYLSIRAVKDNWVNKYNV